MLFTDEGMNNIFQNPRCVVFQDTFCVNNGSETQLHTFIKLTLEYGGELYKWKLGDPEWTGTGLVDDGYRYDGTFGLGEGFKIAVLGETVYVGKRNGELFQRKNSFMIPSLDILMRFASQRRLVTMLKKKTLCQTTSSKMTQKRLRCGILMSRAEHGHSQTHQVMHIIWRV